MIKCQNIKITTNYKSIFVGFLMFEIDVLNMYMRKRQNMEITT